jgi:hypothetical protein
VVSNGCYLDELVLKKELQVLYSIQSHKGRDWYPSIGELLGDEFCENLFSEKFKKLKSLKLTADEFLLLTESLLTEKQLWGQLFSICERIVNLLNREPSLEWLTLEERKKYSKWLSMGATDIDIEKLDIARIHWIKEVYTYTYRYLTFKERMWKENF